MSFFRTHLRARLVVIALLAVAPAVAALAVTQSRGRLRARERTIDENQRLTRLAAGQQARLLEGAQRLLLTLSEFPGLRGDDPRACFPLLPNILRAHADYFNVGAVNADGSPFCMAAPVDPHVLPTARGRAWFERAIERRTTAIGEYQLSAATGKPAIVVAHPMLDRNGHVFRVLEATIALDQLNGVVARAELPGGATITLFDRSRTILARSPDGARWIGKKVPEAAAPTLAGASEGETTAEAVGVDGVFRLYVQVPVQTSFDSGLFIGMGVDHATAFREADQIFRAYLWVLALVLLAAVVAAIIAGHLVVLKPVKELTRVAKRLAAGDLSARTDMPTAIAGIGELEEAVNTMAAALDSRQRERDRADQELRASDDRYRLLFSRNPHPMWVYDRETLRFLEVNDAAVARYGYSRAEFLVMRIADIRPAEDVERLNRVLSEPRQTWEHSDGWRHRLKSGAIIDVEVSSHTLTFSGRSAVVVTAQDVTDRRRAESALLERIVTTALTADVSVALNRSADLDQCLNSCAESLTAHLDASVARIWLLDATGTTLNLTASAGITVDGADGWSRIAVGETCVGRIAQQRRAYATNDAIGDAQLEGQPWLAREGLRTFVACPLLVESRIVGVVAVCGRAPLSEVMTTAVASAADLIGLGIARHQAEAARRDSELRFGLIADTVTQVFWIADVSKRSMLYVSAAYEQIWGRTCESLFRNPGSFVEAVHPEDRERVAEALRAQDEGRPFEHEYRIVRPDGDVRWIRDRGFPVRTDSGVVVHYVGVADDITERLRAVQALREAEERMRFALEASHVGVWEVSLSTDVTYWSDTCQAMHGLTPGTFGNSQKAFVECVHPDDRQAVLDAIDQAVREHKDSRLEYRTLWPNGTVRWISSVGRFFYDPAGTPTRGAGIVSDVTDRRSLEEQLRQSQKMEAIGQLAGGVAHDFNNLLTAILGFAGFLAESLPDTDPRRGDVDEIRQAAERAAGLTRQLLAFSRKQILAVRVLHLGEAVGELTPMLRRLLGESIELTTTIGDRGLVKADPGQIQQVVVNLAVNAHDAMRDGGNLTIATADVVLDEAFARRHPSVQPGPHVRLTVTDTGHGMDAATLKRVFEPFFTTKPQGQGTGLGLATVYGIVKQSGGSIWVESEPGRGTTFTVYLPRTDEREAAEQPHAADTRVAGGAETVLLIEDEALVREYVHKVLTRHGYTVHEFANPTSAITYAEEHASPIDLVLTDVVLPTMSGKTALGRILEHHPESSALFMSGYADHAIVQQGILDAGTAFLPKPFTPAALGRKVREVLDGATATRS